MRVETTGLSDKGRVRQINEDSFVIETPPDSELRSRLGTLLVVADGMGGANAGEVASALATQVIPDVYYEARGDQQQALAEALRAAQATIERESSLGNGREGMGTTVVAACITDERMVVGTVGDSRLYLIRKGEIHQVTRDHSLVAELVARGALSAEQARFDPRRNVITRVLGGDNSPPDYYSAALEMGDVVLLCTDGLHGLVSTHEMLEAVQRFELPEAASHLAALANQRGGHDNLTMVLASIEPE